jgi:hypothetical protein
MIMKTFYMVWKFVYGEVRGLTIDSGPKPWKVYNTFNEALDAANELAMAYPTSEYTICEVTRLGTVSVTRAEYHTV